MKRPPSAAELLAWARGAGVEATVTGGRLVLRYPDTPRARWWAGALRRRAREVVGQLHCEAAERVLSLPLASLDCVVRILNDRHADPWWFVPSAAVAERLAAAGVPRGGIWTPREVASFLPLEPGPRRTALTVFLATKEFGGAYVFVESPPPPSISQALEGAVTAVRRTPVPEDAPGAPPPTFPDPQEDLSR